MDIVCATAIAIVLLGALVYVVANYMWKHHAQKIMEELHRRVEALEEGADRAIRDSRRGGLEERGEDMNESQAQEEAQDDCSVCLSFNWHEDLGETFLTTPKEERRARKSGVCKRIEGEPLKWASECCALFEFDPEA